MPKRSYKRREDGRIRVKYHEHYFYGETQTEAIRKRDAFINAEKAGLQSEQKTVREFVMEWLPIAKASVSDKCYNDYARQLDKLTRVVGGMVLDSVKPSDIKAVWTEYLGMSQSTIHRARMIFNALFEAAVADGYCRTNPCKPAQAQPHRGTAGTHRCITDEERQLILNTPHRFRLAAMVMLYAGLRRGECLALNIDKNVDTEKGLITIEQAIRYDGNQPITSAPKTSAGKRTVPLLQPLREALEGHHGLVMTSAKGKPCTQQAFKRGWQSYLHALSVAAGHDISIRCHDLRHTYCTMLRDAGVQMKLAMKWMGHADEKMILRIYDHVTEYRVKNAVENVEKILQRGQNGGQTENQNSETVEI